MYMYTKSADTKNKKVSASVYLLLKSTTTRTFWRILFFVA